jgi:hypothetical protein
LNDMHNDERDIQCDREDNGERLEIPIHRETP